MTFEFPAKVHSENVRRTLLRHGRMKSSRDDQQEQAKSESSTGFRLKTPLVSLEVSAALTVRGRRLRGLNLFRVVSVAFCVLVVKTIREHFHPRDTENTLRHGELISNL